MQSLISFRRDCVLVDTSKIVGVRSVVHEPGKVVIYIDVLSGQFYMVESYTYGEVLDAISKRSFQRHQNDFILEV